MHLYEWADNTISIECHYKCGWYAVGVEKSIANVTIDEHIKVCKNHPMRQLERENRRLKGKVQQLKKQVKKLLKPS